MKNKFILSLVLGVLVLSILSTGFVSAGLFKRFTITGNAIGSNGWTSWYDRDGPGGSGDWELRSSLDLGDCKNPTKIECQTVDGKTIEETGQTVICNLNTGLVCLNKENGGSNFLGTTCLDYRIRFYCGSGVEEKSVCDSDGKCTLVEGSSAVATLDGMNYTLSIAYISATEVKINVNDQVTKTLRQYEMQNLEDVKIKVKNIAFNSKTAGISKVGMIIEKYSAPANCGNGIINTGEQCDENNLAGATCTSLGFNGGTLSCSISCAFDISKCVSPTNSTTEVTYQGVLDMLSNCHWQAWASPNTNNAIAEICASNEICVDGFVVKHSSNFSNPATIFPSNCNAVHRTNGDSDVAVFARCCPRP